MRSIYRFTLCAGLAVLAATVAPAATAVAHAQQPARTADTPYKRAADYSEAERGSAVVVMVDGRIVFEQYKDNGSPARTHLLASGTKSFVGPLAVAAQADGMLSLDERVSETLTEWRGDPRREVITVRQLLSLTSGIAGDTGLMNPPSYIQATVTSMTAEPGATFQYGPAPFQIFGEVLKRKLAARGGETVNAYLRRRLLDPIGIRTGFWRGAAQGEPQLPSGAYLTAREWAKWGEFIRQEGAWNGQQLVPKELLDQCFVGTAANPAYGLTWWLNREVPPPLRATIRQLRDNLGGMEQVPGLEGMVVAAGAFKQRLYVIPSRRMVVVRYGNSVGPQFDDARFLGLLTGAIRE